MIDAILNFVQSNKAYFEAANALSTAMNFIAWCFALVFLLVMRRQIHSIEVGPISIKVKEEAVSAAASAARNWPGQPVDVPRIRKAVNKAFTPETANNLTGKSILWVDDKPQNNALVVRALRRLHLEIEQVTDSKAAVTALQNRRFDLIVSDMGRGDNPRAGYDLLKYLRATGVDVPYFIFSSGDTPGYRREAKELGAQLSTNDMLELIEYVVAYLGEKP